jgi:hypothetical protein
MRSPYGREQEMQQLESENPARKTYERFMHVPKDRSDFGGLNGDPSTSISITIQRHGQLYRVTQPSYGSIPLVEVQDGPSGWRPADNQLVTAGRFPIRIFSQGQLVTLAAEGSALLTLVDEEAGTRSERSALQDEASHFLAVRAELRATDGRLAARDEIAIRLEDVQSRLTKFEEANQSDLLERFQRRKRQDEVLKHHAELAAAGVAEIERAGKSLELEIIPPDLFESTDATDQEAVLLLEQIAGAVGEAVASTRMAAAKLKQDIERYRNGMFESTWQRKVTEVGEEYKLFVNARKELGIEDSDAYGQLIIERQRLESQLSEISVLTAKHAELEAEATASRGRCLRLRREVSQKREQFLANTITDNAFVRIKLFRYGRDMRTIEGQLRDVLNVADSRFEDDILVIASDEVANGIVAKLMTQLPSDSDEADQLVETRLDSLKRSLRDTCEGGPSEFGGRFINFLKREYDKSPEVLDRLLAWYPDDSLAVEYSPQGNGKDFRSITQASDGQRAAAMLAFLLAYGTDPLILDQPEDDLDNELIYSLVVKQIRENKKRRQIIVITHNPNVVVNGDAELINVLEFKGGQCRIARAGCLQEAAIREDICRVLEGGREAFDLRYTRMTNA